MKSAIFPRALQAKLLRVLQSGTFERVGGTESIHVDVRIVAATHRILEEEVKRGRFRADLFYRLNVIRIDLPPLRERTEDIPLLAMHFLEKHRSQKGTPVTEMATDAMQALLRHTWPGNVRELENAIKAGIALADGSVLHRDDLPESVAPRTSHLAALSLAARRRAFASGADLRLDRAGRAGVFRPIALAVQGKRGAMCPPQRVIAAERDPEASEIRPGACRVQRRTSEHGQMSSFASQSRSDHRRRPVARLVVRCQAHGNSTSLNSNSSGIVITLLGVS